MLLYNTTADLRRLARNRIDAARLSSAPPLQTWGGRGTGQVCHLCDQPISEQDIEYEVHVAVQPAQLYYFHLPCHFAWRCECEQS
jgi:hypothetical protein